MKHALNRRSFLGATGTLLASSSQPKMFQLFGRVKADTPDTTCLVHGPYLTKHDVLARQQTFDHRLQEACHRFEANISDELNETCLKTIRALAEDREREEI